MCLMLIAQGDQLRQRHESDSVVYGRSAMVRIESDDKSFDPSNEKLVSLFKWALWLTILISHLLINSAPA